MAEIEYLKECFICETNHYDALKKEVWDYLEITSPVDLVFDGDHNRVCVRTPEDKGKMIIGVLSKEDSESIIKYIKQGWGKSLFNICLCGVDKKADENKRFSIAISIKKHQA